MANKIVLRSTNGVTNVAAAISTGAQGPAGPSSGGAVASVNGQTGTVALTEDNMADGTTYKRYSATEKTKLAGIATGATANDTDANLKNRANHTGTEPVSGIAAGSSLTVYKSGGTWPSRPTTRTDVTVIWTGATPGPTINTTLTGTTGAYDGIDKWDKTP